MISFTLNGAPAGYDGPPTRTLLDWLRARGLTGTKEGCNEGDCGACSVIVTDADGARALNACILFMPQLHSKAVRTVEGLAGPDGQPHPVQTAMVEHHGSQCGFCTPGFVVTMAAAHLNGAEDWDDQLAGNLCRCTGYAPILRAAEAAAKEAVPEWVVDSVPALSGDGEGGTPGIEAPAQGGGDGYADHPSDWGHTDPLSATGASSGDAAESRAFHLPESADEAAALYAAHPDATIVAGATDVGLWVTKGMRDLGRVIFLHRARDLARIEETAEGLRIGAMATMRAVREAVADRHPAFAELIRRYGSEQVRGAATIGGNIANGSPIGDSPPALIALGATLHLRHGDARREMPIEAFFIEYGKQDRRPGELVEAITIPAQEDRLSCHKLSKRFDQDISAVCGCFTIRVSDGTVTEARLAYGGMAGIPKRAIRAEDALIGKSWTEDTVRRAMDALDEDFTPLSDMRASAEYRLASARNMLLRTFHEDRGALGSVLAL